MRSCFARKNFSITGLFSCLTYVSFQDNEIHFSLYFLLWVWLNHVPAVRKKGAMKWPNLFQNTIQTRLHPVKRLSNRPASESILFWFHPLRSCTETFRFACSSRVYIQVSVFVPKPITFACFALRSDLIYHQMIPQSCFSPAWWTVPRKIGACAFYRCLWHCYTCGVSILLPRYLKTRDVFLLFRSPLLFPAEPNEQIQNDFIDAVSLFVSLDFRSTIANNSSAVSFSD